MKFVMLSNLIWNSKTSIMKKLLTLILLATIFISCSKDEDDNTVYLDNKLIEGSWYWIQASDSTVYTFSNVVKRETFDKYTLASKGGHNFGIYKLTADDIKYEETGNSQKYKINRDTLYLYINNTFIKHIKVK